MAVKGEKETATSARFEVVGEKGLPLQNRGGSRTDDGVPVDSASEEKARHSDSEGEENAVEISLQNGTPASKGGIPRVPQSRRTSSFAKTASVIPRSERRGLFGHFTIIPEIERPYEYTRKTKWLITAIVALAAAASPMGSGIFYRKLCPCLACSSTHIL
jgi:hypothetical protein